MSIEVMNRVWKYSKQSSTDLLLLLAIADHCDADGIAWPGIKKLAEKTRTSERQTTRNVDKLANSGELFLLRQCGRGHSNLYFITVGLNRDEIVQILEDRFDLDKDIWSLADSIINQSTAVKGDTDVSIYEEIKGDTGDIKGDTGDQEKVTPVTIKGDIAMSPEPSINRHIETSIEPGPLCQSLLKVCQKDFLFVQDNKWLKEKMLATLGYLVKQQAQPADVVGFGDWQRDHHWTGKNGNAPSFDNVGALWPEYKNWIKNGRPNGVYRNGHRQMAEPTAEDIERNRKIQAAFDALA